MNSNLNNLKLKNTHFIELNMTDSIEIISSKFNNNTFLSESSLLSVFNSKLTIKNSIFSENFLENSNILILNFQLIFNDNYLIKNQLKNSSLIYCYNENNQNELLLNFTKNVTIKNNTSYDQKPLFLDIQSENTLLSINQISFENNNALKSLISIYCFLSYNSNIYISNIFIIKNFGSNFIEIIDINNLNIENYQCISNNDKNTNSLNNFPGPCLFIKNFQNINLKNLIFQNNFAISTLTGIIIEETKQFSLIFPSKIIISYFLCDSNTVFSLFDSLFYSGNCLFFSNKGEIILKNSTISNNIIDVNVNLESMYGGNTCLNSISNDNNLIINNVMFIKNQAYTESVCIKFFGRNFELINSSFLENNALKKSKDPLKKPNFHVGNEGSALNLGCETLILKNTTIYSSISSKGTGLFIHNRKFKLFQNFTVYNLNIIKNTALQTAGIEFDASLDLGEFYFYNLSIIDNYVELYAVISTFQYTDLVIYFQNCNFSNNHGINAGSALALFQLNGKLYINNCFFGKNIIDQNNLAGGGAIFLYGSTFSTFLFVKNSLFQENYSSLKGGAICALYGSIELIDSVFIDNQGEVGGAISVDLYCPALFKNLIIKSRFKANKGGGIAIFYQSPAQFINVSFINCNANSGGGLYINDINSVFKFKDLSFDNVTGDQGAAFWLYSAFPNINSINNITIKNVKADSSIIYTQNMKINFYNINITNSIGRLFYFTKSIIDFSKSYFIDNKCIEELKGSFIYINMISELNLTEIKIDKHFSKAKEDIISGIDTKIKIFNIKISNIVISDETILLYCISCEIILINSIFKDYNEALISLSYSSLTIIECLFENISIKLSKTAIVTSTISLKLNISNSEFKNISGLYGSALFISEGFKSFCLIKNSTFSENKAEKGGSLFIKDQNIEIINCYFKENKASIGGAIFFDSTLLLNTSYLWLISNTIFFKNSALKGGCYHSERFIPKLKNTSFIENKAKYGPKYSGFPLYLTLQKPILNTTDFEEINCDKQPDKCYILDYYTSGQVLSPLIIVLKDYYNQTMILEEGIGKIQLVTKDINNINLLTVLEQTNYSLINISSEAVFTGFENQKIENGVFNFSNIRIQSKPPSNLIIRIKTEIITEYYKDFLFSNSFFHRKNSLNNNNEYELWLPIYLRTCKIGEIYIQNGKECMLCPKNKYSLLEKSYECNFCPQNVICDGGSHFSLYPGFWRANLYTDIFYSCNSLTDSCLGGIDSECLNGYTGKLCGICIFNSEKQFFKKGLFYCEQCLNIWIYIIILFIFIIGIFGLIGLLVKNSSSKLNSSADNYILIKIITNHLQTIALFANLKIEFPKFLKSYNSVQAPVTSIDSFMFTIECFKDSFTLSIYQMKLILSIVITFIIIISTIIVIIVKNRNRKSEENKKTIINALVVIANFFQPSFINFYIQNLSCDQIEDKKYLYSNLEQECWDSNHLVYSIVITIPMIFFWMILFPCFFMIYLLKNRNKLDNENVFRITRFFQTGYQKDKYYWEFIQMSRKFTIILLTAFLRNNNSVLIYILIPIIVFYFALQIIFQPFSNKIHNIIEILSLNACFITYYSALFYLKIITDEAKMFFLIIIVTFNLVFFMIWCKQYILFLKGKIKSVISMIKTNSMHNKGKKHSIVKLKSLSNKIKIAPKK